MMRQPAFWRDQRGASAAEFALMLPLMLVLIFAGLEAGYYVFTEHKVIKAVREGSRYAGRLQWSNYDCLNGTVDGTAEQNIRNVTRTGFPAGTVPHIPGWTDGQVSVSLDCDSATTTGIFEGNGTAGAPRVTVSTTTTYPSLFNGFVGLDNTGTIHASAQAVVNGI